jgi:hypothetical protein
MNLILKGNDGSLISSNCEIKVKNEFDIQEFLYVDARFYISDAVDFHIDIDKRIQGFKDNLNKITEIGFDQGYNRTYVPYKDNLSLDCIQDETILILEGVLYLCMDIVFVRKDQQ